MEVSARRAPRPDDDARGGEVGKAALRQRASRGLAGVRFRAEQERGQDQQQGDTHRSATRERGAQVGGAHAPFLLSIIVEFVWTPSFRGYVRAPEAEPRRQRPGLRAAARDPTSSTERRAYDLLTEGFGPG